MAVGLEGYSWQLVRLGFPVGLVVVGALVDVLVVDVVDGDNVDDVAAVGFVGCRLGILGVGWVLIFANLCRCNVLGVSGGLVLISNFLLGC